MQVRGVVPDHLLLQLLVTWLSPAAQLPTQEPARPELGPEGCCRSQASTAGCTLAHRHNNEAPPLQVCCREI